MAAQGHLTRDNFQIKFFKLDSWSLGLIFFPNATINLYIKFDEDNRFLLKKQFCNFEKCFLRRFSSQDIPVPYRYMYIAESYMCYL